MIDFELQYTRFRYYLTYLTDLRYGGFFGGFRKTRYGHLGAHSTMSSYYFVLSRLFGNFPIKDSDVLVDVGCGRGRVVNWWLRKGCRNRIVGIELDGTIAAEAQRAFRNYGNVEIVHGNALGHIPEDGTVFYLYNPFDRDVMTQFKDRVKERCTRWNEVRVYYVNCEFLDAFRGDPDWTVATNCEEFKGDAAWPVRGLDVGMSYPVAVLEPSAHAIGSRQMDEWGNGTYHLERVTGVQQG